MPAKLRPYVLACALLLLVAGFNWFSDRSGTETTTDVEASISADEAAAGGSLTKFTTTTASGDPSATTVDTASASSLVIARVSDLSVIDRSDLPPEALDTLDDIANGGPYPFAKDDSIFQNREQLLPLRSNGHYREYTVVTPGESDRGARRIVAGANGELYYTSDHYDSFYEILP
jgi:ribonuclease T1